MAAPTPTTRGTPAGTKLKDGFSTKITFARYSTAEFWEKVVGLAGADNGEGIEQTTMHTVRYRQVTPRQLITLTPFDVDCAYDPDVTHLLDMVGREDTVTETYPDGTTVAYFAYLQKYAKKPNEEGKQPELTLTICPTNWDPTNKVEAGPAIASVTGT